jgi:hypothetical protein
VRPRVAVLSLPAMLLTAVLALPSSLATADSFTPVRLSIRAAPVARRQAPLAVRVVVSADPDVLATSEGPVRIEVKLSGECGGTFETTPGVTLLNQQLSPQPAAGRAYSATASGSGRPNAYGSQTLCMFLEDTAVGRVYAQDESSQVDVSRPCTVAGLRYDAARRSLVSAQRGLRRAHSRAARRSSRRLVGKRRRGLARAHRRGLAACGRGVPL